MQKGLEDYIVPFSSLKPGRYEYDFKVSDSFFTHFEQSEVKAGQLDVRFELQRQPVMLALAFDITGTVNLPCDRCGDSYDQPIECHRRMVIHLGGEPQDDEDDIVVLAAHDHSLDLSRYLFEFITLSIPSRRVHPDNADGTSGCDPEVIAKLNELRTGDDEDGNAPSDPRWAALKGLSFGEEE